MLRGFKNFLMRGDLVTAAVAFVIALAFKHLIQEFVANIIKPLIASAGGGSGTQGLGWQLVEGGGHATFVDLGAFISAIIYFIIFMFVIYFAIVIPYKEYMKRRRGETVFGDPEPPPPTKTCPACLSDDLNPAATKCKHCGTELEAQRAVSSN